MVYKNLYETINYSNEDIVSTSFNNQYILKGFMGYIVSENSSWHVQNTSIYS